MIGDLTPCGTALDVDRPGPNAMVLPVVSGRRRRDVAWMALIFGVLVFNSAFRGLWLQVGLPWWTPFGVWGLVIAGGACVSWRWLAHDD